MSRLLTLIDRLAALNPNDRDVQRGRACLYLDWQADTRPLHALRQKSLAEHS